MDWGILVKGNCADKQLKKSLLDNSDVKYNKIYLYRAKMLTENYNRTSYNMNIESQYSINNYSIGNAIDQVENYIEEKEVDISKDSIITISEVTKDTFDINGIHESSEVVEYLVAYSEPYKSLEGHKLKSLGFNPKIAFFFSVNKDGVKEIN